MPAQADCEALEVKGIIDAKGTGEARMCRQRNRVEDRHDRITVERWRIDSRLTDYLLGRDELEDALWPNLKHGLGPGEAGGVTPYNVSERWSRQIREQCVITSTGDPRAGDDVAPDRKNSRAGLGFNRIAIAAKDQFDLDTGERGVTGILVDEDVAIGRRNSVLGPPSPDVA
jgi:hypothetical protein